ncbi:MAG: hypothetical protein SPI74_00580 [Eubacterium sp.]|nr:hypothetical protein [Eubacterium sp.]
MKKQKNKSMTRVSKDGVLSLIPIRKYDYDLNAFVLTDGMYMGIEKIIARDIENMSDDELDMELLNLIKIYKTALFDIKFVSLNFPLNTQKQKDVLLRHKEKAADSVKIKWIDRQIEELSRAESGVLTREFYIFYFGKNKSAYEKNNELLSRYMGSGHLKLTESLTLNEKIQILNKLSNMNTTLSRVQDGKHIENIIEKGKNKEEFDTALFEKIQPKGGVSFKDPSYVRFGDGYASCLHVYALPSYISEFWIINLFNIPGCICTFDVTSKNRNVVKKNITKSISEEKSRIGEAKDYEEYYEASKRKAELEELYDNISRLGEVIKLVDFRIFVKAKTLKKLDEKTAEVLENLDGDGYLATIMLNEQRKEWQSLFEPYEITHSKAATLKGLTLTSEQLAMGFPFCYSELLDDEGVLLGFSKAGGVILYDPFAKTKKRSHYNSIVCGNMGSGKSTHLKKLFKHSASIGNFIRVFDVSGEFASLTNEFGGKIIRCSGREGMLNPLEILKAGENDEVSYANHISKLQTFFKCIIPSMDDMLRQELANQLRAFYAAYDLTPENENKITGRAATEYPILSDFKNYLINMINKIKSADELALTDVETNLNIEKAKNLSSLLGAVENLINNYGSIFNGHSAINNITNEQIVCFDISAIKDLGDIFAAQMQILVSLCWDNAVSNGTKMKDKWENEDEVESTDITKFLVLIDESHRWINTLMPQILDMILRYMREARKYFAGIVLASQSVRDFMPESTGENIEKIKQLFELSQYKFMFKQDSSVKEHIKNKFSFELTMSQVDRIPVLEVGETILAITGDCSIEFKEWLSKDYEERLFAGGR